MLVFDIETDGLLKEVTKVHCMCIKDTETGKMYRFQPDRVIDGVRMLDDAIKANNVI